MPIRVLPIVDISNMDSQHKSDTVIEKAGAIEGEIAYHSYSPAVDSFDPMMPFSEPVMQQFKGP